MADADDKSAGCNYRVPPKADSIDGANYAHDQMDECFRAGGKLPEKAPRPYTEEEGR